MVNLQQQVNWTRDSIGHTLMHHVKIEKGLINMQAMQKISYAKLNSKQKEARNSYHLMAQLADCGFESHRLHNDYQGADIVALSMNGETLRIQLKGRPTVSKEYLGKGLMMAFPAQTGSEDFVLVDHDSLAEWWMGENESESWVHRGAYSAKTPTAAMRDWIEKNNLLPA